MTRRLLNKSHQMKNLSLTGVFTLFVLLSHAQFLTNVDYHLKFGDLDADAFPGKTTIEGNYVYTVTHTHVTNEGTNILVKKHHIDGTTSWEVAHSNPGTTYDYGIDIAVDGSGNVLVLGAKQNGAGGDYEYQLIKYGGTTGSFMWTYTYTNGGQDDIPTHLTLDGSGNAYMTGIKDHKSASDDVLTICVNSSGTQSWTATYDYDGHPDGGVYLEVDGLDLYCFAVTTGDGGQKELSKIIYELNTGNELSADRTNLGSEFDIKDLKKSSTGAYVACGSKVNTNGDQDIAVYSLDATLGTNWSYTYDGGNTGDDVALALELDASDNCFLTGFSMSAAESKEGILIKLNSSGTQQWSSFFDLPDGFDCEGTKLNLANQVVVCGTFKDQTNESFGFISKYKYGGSKVNFLTIEPTERVRSIGTLESLGRNSLFISGSSNDGTYDERFSLVFDFLPKDTTVDRSDTTKPDVVMNQLIIRFYKNALNTAVFENKNIGFGRLNDFLTSTAISALDTIFPDSVELDSIWVSKIFKNISPNDTLSITRYGDTVKMPAFWQTLLLQFGDDIDPCILALEIDSLDSFYLDPIMFAEANHVLYQRWKPDDPEFDNKQPALNPTSSISNAHIHMEDAWDIEKGKPFVRLGIVDGAIDWKHEDFHLTESDETFEDSKIEGGYDYIDDQRISRNLNFHDHGTEVAGIAGAISNNETGIAGVGGGDMANGNSGVSLYNQRILSDLGSGTLDDVARAIVDGAWDDPNSTTDLALSIMNDSWGDDTGTKRIEDGYATMTEAFRFAFINGVISVCSSADIDKKFFSYPDSYRDDWVIKGGASDANKERWVGLGQDGSAYGHNLDLIAPGSSDLVYTTANGIGHDDYKSNAGTSFAIPLMSGTVGLMLSYKNEQTGAPSKKNLAIEDVEWILQQTAEDLVYNNSNENAPTGYDEWTGYGLLRADKALAYLEEPNFLIKHYQVSSWRETKIEDEVFIKITDDYFPGNDETGQLKDNGVQLCKNKKYKANVYYVEADVEFDWPAGGYSIVTSSMYPDIQESGYWPLNSRSNLWGWNSITKDIDPYTQVRFLVFPHKSGSKLKATIGGYFYLIKHQKFKSGTPIYKWYPHSDKERHKMAFSVYFTKQWPLKSSDVRLANYTIYPNPARDKLNIEVKGESHLVRIEIHDLLGKKVLDAGENSILGLKPSLDISSLRNGFYLVSLIESDGSRRTLKYEILK